MLLVRQEVLMFQVVCSICIGTKSVESNRARDQASEGTLAVISRAEPRFRVHVKSSCQVLSSVSALCEPTSYLCLTAVSACIVQITARDSFTESTFAISQESGRGKLQSCSRARLNVA